ncbi:MAG: carboxypeptidase regulatory-like domain-containing protein [Verrucomicrobia bacterium]|nr:carboxypeptidase regulatory-like domain-containing protein [Verrucomicrobiota bacterium]
MKSFVPILTTAWICAIDAPAQNQANAQSLAVPKQSEGGSTNRVLELDGKGSYVELPNEVFKDLNEATIETWVRWKSFGQNARVFHSGVFERSRGAMVLSEQANPEKNGFKFFLVGPEDGSNDGFVISGLLVPDEWFHFAAVSGKGGMRLFVNGELVGTDDFTGSFASLRRGDPNYIGKSTNPQHTTLNGQLAEFRVWRMARSQEEIKRDMFRQLTGNEAGLAGLWNYSDPAHSGKDSSSRGNHGQLFGHAQVGVTRLPDSSELARPCIFYGTVLDEVGQRVSGLRLQFVQETITATADSEHGTYLVAVDATNKTCQVLASSERGGVHLSGVELHPGTRTELNLKLSSAGSITGTLRTFDDKPHVAVVVQAIDKSGQVTATALSDQTGNYRFENLKPGDYQVRCVIINGFHYFVSASETELVRTEDKSQISNQKSEIKVRVQPGRTTEKIDFRFAPLKKGTWQTYNVASGLVGDSRIGKVLIEPNGVI